MMLYPPVPNFWTEKLDPANLWDHQNQEASYAAEPSRIMLWEPRVGKTRATIACIKTWFELGVTKVLIVAPQTVCGSVWDEEIRACFHANLGNNHDGIDAYSLYQGSLAQRRVILKYIDTKVRNRTIVIVNRDSIAALEDDLLAWGPEAVVLDELHDYKTPSSERHKAALHLCAKARFRRGLTGTPTPNSYADLYGQYKVIEPRIFGTRFTDFRDRYLIPHPKWPSKWVGYRNVEELRERALSIATIVKREQVFALPEIQEITCKVTLHPKAKKLYDQIAKEHVAEFEKGNMLFDHVLARLTRLQQLASGFLETPDSDNPWQHTAKIDAAVEVIEDLTADYSNTQKVVVFHRFRPEGHKLVEQLPKKHVAWINGDTPSETRTKLITRFNSPTDALRVLVIQEQVGSVGISLRGADHAIFLSMGFSYAVHTQARDRIFKAALEIGKKLTYTYITATGTVDVWVRRIVRTKEVSSLKLLTGDFKDIVMGMGDEAA